MKEAVLDVIGQTPRYGEFEEPVAQDGEAIVEVAAASIKQLDRAIAAGKHYSSPRALPVVCGTDGAGRLADGTRVYFATGRRPFGAMTERAPASLTVPLPDGLDARLAAAIVNPALAAWLPLVWRVRLLPGEAVLVLGATGAAGRMAVRAARLLGAGRVIAAGRRQDALNALDADATIDLRLPAEELKQAFAEEAARGLGIVVDYVWGAAAEALIGVLVKSDLSADLANGEGVRLVSVGAMAAPTITLPSSALRGSRLTILGSGTANYPPAAQLRKIIADILSRTARGELSLDVAPAPLASVAETWTAGDADRRSVLTLRLAPAPNDSIPPCGAAPLFDVRWRLRGGRAACYRAFDTSLRAFRRKGPARPVTIVAVGRSKNGRGTGRRSRRRQMGADNARRPGRRRGGLSSIA